VKSSCKNKFTVEISSGDSARREPFWLNAVKITLGPMAQRRYQEICRAHHHKKMAVTGLAKEIELQDPRSRLWVAKW